MLNRTDRAEHCTDFELTMKGIEDRRSKEISLCQDSFIPVTSFSFKLQLFKK